ncbi:uncharacterized protein LOC120555240 [Perca fluviatilis]|uniref:uncharacterized protein LOC120555240 n=1 Tax=Perca fluviatilis TaxID=8168 RepID=UPI001962C4B2|nr:uncharacterized protein LOC120555240 [Perca fluviatilis]
MERWLAIRSQHSPPNDYVFFTAGKGPVKNMVRYMQTAWAEMGLEGRPNFIDIRTAVSAHTKNVHSKEVRKEMAVFMCHNVSTADKFYALNLSVGQCRAIRARFEEVAATPEEESSSALPSTSTSAMPSAAKRRREEKSDDSSTTCSDVVEYQESGSSSLEDDIDDVSEEEDVTCQIEENVIVRSRGGTGAEEEEKEEDEGHQEEQGVYTKEEAPYTQS